MIYISYNLANKNKNKNTAQQFMKEELCLNFGRADFHFKQSFSKFQASAKTINHRTFSPADFFS